MQFIVFHGSFTDVNTHWFPAFRTEMTAQGHDVLLPQFPVNPFDEVKESSTGFVPNQELGSWMSTFESQILPKLSDSAVWVGHSLGNLFMLHVLEKYPSIKLESALFVVPFYKEVNQGKPHPWQFDVVNKTFYRDEFDFDQLKRQIGFSYTLYSKDDPYVPNDDSLDFAYKLDSTAIPVSGGKHLGSHLNKFRLVEELVKSMVGYNLGNEIQ